MSKTLHTQTAFRLGAVACVTLLLAGCVTPPGAPGAAGAASQDPCDVVQTGVTAAVAGGIIGGLLGGRDGAARGAVLGGLVATVACVTMNAQSRQVRTAAEVDRDFVRRNGALQRTPTLVSYTPTLAANSVQRGQPLRVNSTIQLANGSTEQIRSVREVLTILDPEGNTVQVSGAREASAASAGEFSNTFNVNTAPPPAAQGFYTFRTNLFVNDRQMATRDLWVQKVWNESDQTVRFALAQ